MSYSKFSNRTLKVERMKNSGKIVRKYVRKIFIPSFERCYFRFETIMIIIVKTIGKILGIYMSIDEMYRNAA